MTRPSTYIALVLVAAAAVVAFHTHRDAPPKPAATSVGGLAKEGHWMEEAWPEQSQLLGKPMPPLPLSHWIGTEVVPDGMRGRVVVLDFWATWCAPCRAAVPHNNEIARSYTSRGVLVIGVCGGGGEEKMPEVAKADKIEYPVAVTTPETQAAWHIKWFPSYAIVDRQGNVRALGIKPDYVEPVLDALLKEEAATGPATTGPVMQGVRVAGDGRGFVLHPSGRPFTPWGMNYSSNDIEDRWDKDWAGVERDLAELKRLGANVLRIHLQFNRFMAGPEQFKGRAFGQLDRFLKLAEARGLYLDITGLACYTPADNQAWYDALDERQRWAVQARFWQAVARRCASSPAVFCYDLMNEPVSPGGDGRKPGQWYSGQLFGGYDYLQWIALAQGDRPREVIARDWARTLAAAIRKEDREHMVTVGLLPTLKGSYFFGFVPVTLAPEVDFISVHIYPKHEDQAEAMRILKQFVVAGKPLVVEETFPLSCSAEELRKFLLESRGTACGWIGHYLGKSRKELEDLKQGGRLTIPDATSLQWLELFEEMRGRMNAE